MFAHAFNILDHIRLISCVFWRIKDTRISYIFLCLILKVFVLDPGEGSLAELITHLMEYVVLALEVVIAIFIIVIVSRTLFDLFKKYVTGFGKKQVLQQQQLYNSQIVTRMLRGLLYSLDFLIAVDILKTIMTPSQSELLYFLAIVVIRILLSWAMSKELEKSDPVKYNTD